MNFYFTFSNHGQAKALVNRFIHHGMSASLRPIRGTTNRWSVFGKTSLPAVEIEPIAFGIKYIGFLAEEEDA